MGTEVFTWLRKNAGSGMADFQGRSNGRLANFSTDTAGGSVVDIVNDYEAVICSTYLIISNTASNGISLIQLIPTGSCLCNANKYTIAQKDIIKDIRNSYLHPNDDARRRACFINVLTYPSLFLI